MDGSGLTLVVVVDAALHVGERKPCAAGRGPAHAPVRAGGAPKPRIRSRPSLGKPPRPRPCCGRAPGCAELSQAAGAGAAASGQPDAERVRTAMGGEAARDPCRKTTPRRQEAGHRHVGAIRVSGRLAPPFVGLPCGWRAPGYVRISVKGGSDGSVFEMADPSRPMTALCGWGIFLVRVKKAPD